MSLTICAEYFVIDWNFSYIEDTSCIHGLSSDFQIVLSNSIYGRIGFLLTYRYLFTLKMSYKKIIHKPCQRVQYLLQCLPFSDLHELPKKAVYCLWTEKHVFYAFVNKICMFVIIHSFLSYLWCTWLIYWEFSAISIMYFKINIIFHINQVFDLKKKIKLPKNDFLYIFLSLFVDIGFVFNSIQCLKLNRNTECYMEQLWRDYV